MGKFIGGMLLLGTLFLMIGFFLISPIAGFIGTGLTLTFISILLCIVEKKEKEQK